MFTLDQLFRRFLKDQFVQPYSEEYIEHYTEFKKLLIRSGYEHFSMTEAIEFFNLIKKLSSNLDGFLNWILKNYPDLVSGMSMYS